MNQTTANVDPENLVQVRIDFLEYVTEFLTQFTVSAEQLHLLPIAYFLGMAVTECSDTLAKFREDKKAGQLRSSVA